jgi:hypothetical protein
VQRLESDLIPETLLEIATVEKVKVEQFRIDLVNVFIKLMCEVVQWHVDDQVDIAKAQREYSKLTKWIQKFESVLTDVFTLLHCFLIGFSSET